MALYFHVIILVIFGVVQAVVFHVAQSWDTVLGNVTKYVLAYFDATLLAAHVC